MTDEINELPAVDPQAVANPPVVVSGELIEASWGNAVVTAIGNVASLPTGSGSGSIANHLFDHKTTLDGILHPPAVTPITIGTGTATTGESTIATFTIPATGMYMIGYQLDIAPGTGFGFLDGFLKVGAAPVTAVFPLRWMEPGTAARAAANGLTLADFTTGQTVNLRVKTFSGSVAINGGSIAAFLVRFP